MEAWPPRVRLAAGPAHACAIRESGELYCWGNNDHGQIGDLTTDPRPTPVHIGPGIQWAAVTAGGDECTTGCVDPRSSHTCAIVRDGSLYCWGSNAGGELGNGTTTAFSAPWRVGMDFDWVAVDAGFGATCGIKRNGTLWCWGAFGHDRNTFGDVQGLGPSYPIQVGSANDWVAIDLGHNREATANGSMGCGVRSSGELHCWNESPFETPPSPFRSPDRAGSESDWESVCVSGGDFSGNTRDQRVCGTRRGGSFYCTVTTNLDDAQRIGDNLDWRAPNAGSMHGCALHRDLVWCWGSNEFGARGVESSTDLVNAVPMQDWRLIAAGNGFACGEQTDASVYCWGRNLSGELGAGITADKLVPTLVDTNRWRKVAGGTSSTLALRDDGSLWGWGLGRSRPRLTALGPWASVGVAYFHACAIRSSGELDCWFIDDPSVQRDLAQVGARRDWQSVSVDRGGACAIRAGGALYCFGDSTFYPAGDQAGRTLGSAEEPARLGTDNWAKVEVADEQACAIRADGRLHCWGLIGKQGEANLVSSTPIQIGSYVSWRDIAVGASTACGIRGSDLVCFALRLDAPVDPMRTLDLPMRVVRDGTDPTWVTARYGRVCMSEPSGVSCFAYGDEPRPAGFGDESSPLELDETRRWLGVGFGTAHSCALDNLSSLYCWGSNSNGQIGDGSAWTHEPKRVAIP